MSEQIEGTPEEDKHPLYITLWRIAVALEHQNSITLAWIELQKAWHEEGDPVGQRIVAIQEHEAERVESWRETQRKILSEEAYKEWLASLAKRLMERESEA